MKMICFISDTAACRDTLALYGVDNVLAQQVANQENGNLSGACALLVGAPNLIVSSSSSSSNSFISACDRLPSCIVLLRDADCFDPTVMNLFAENDINDDNVHKMSATHFFEMGIPWIQAMKLGLALLFYRFQLVSPSPCTSWTATTTVPHAATSTSSLGSSASPHSAQSSTVSLVRADLPSTITTILQQTQIQVCIDRLISLAVPQIIAHAVSKRLNGSLLDAILFILSHGDDVAALPERFQTGESTSSSSSSVGTYTPSLTTIRLLRDAACIDVLDIFVTFDVRDRDLITMTPTQLQSMGIAMRDMIKLMIIIIHYRQQQLHEQHSQQLQQQQHQPDASNQPTANTNIVPGTSSNDDNHNQSSSSVASAHSTSTNSLLSSCLDAPLSSSITTQDTYDRKLITHVASEKIQQQQLQQQLENSTQIRSTQPTSTMQPPSSMSTTSTSTSSSSSLSSFTFPLVALQPFAKQGLGTREILIELSSALANYPDSYLQQRSTMCSQGSACTGIDRVCFYAHSQLDRDMHSKLFKQRQLVKIQDLGDVNSASTDIPPVCQTSLSTTTTTSFLQPAESNNSHTFSSISSRISNLLASFASLTLEKAMRLLLHYAIDDPEVASVIHSKSIRCDLIPPASKSGGAKPLGTRLFIIPVAAKQSCHRSNSCPHSHSQAEKLQYRRILRLYRDGPDQFTLIPLSSIMSGGGMGSQLVLPELTHQLMWYPDSYLTQRSTWCRDRSNCSNKDTTCYYAHTQLDHDIHRAILKRRQQSIIELRSSQPQELQTGSSTTNKPSTILTNHSVDEKHVQQQSDQYEQHTCVEPRPRSYASVVADTTTSSSSIRSAMSDYASYPVVATSGPHKHPSIRGGPQSRIQKLYELLSSYPDELIVEKTRPCNQGSGCPNLLTTCRRAHGLDQLLYAGVLKLRQRGQSLPISVLVSSQKQEKVKESKSNAPPASEAPSTHLIACDSSHTTFKVAWSSRYRNDEAFRSAVERICSQPLTQTRLEQKIVICDQSATPKHLKSCFHSHSQHELSTHRFINGLRKQFLENLAKNNTATTILNHDRKCDDNNDDDDDDDDDDIKQTQSGDVDSTQTPIHSNVSLPLSSRLSCSPSSSSSTSTSSSLANTTVEIPPDFPVVVCGPLKHPLMSGSVQHRVDLLCQWLRHHSDEYLERKMTLCPRQEHPIPTPTSNTSNTCSIDPTSPCGYAQGVGMCHYGHGYDIIYHTMVWNQLHPDRVRPIPTKGDTKRNPTYTSLKFENTSTSPTCSSAETSFGSNTSTIAPSNFTSAISTSTCTSVKLSPHISPTAITTTATTTTIEPQANRDVPLTWEDFRDETGTGWDGAPHPVTSSATFASSTIVTQIRQLQEEMNSRWQDEDKSDDDDDDDGVGERKDVVDDSVPVAVSASHDFQPSSIISAQLNIVYDLFQKEQPEQAQNQEAQCRSSRFASSPSSPSSAFSASTVPLSTNIPSLQWAIDAASIYIERAKRPKGVNVMEIVAKSKKQTLVSPKDFKKYVIAFMVDSPLLTTKIVNGVTTFYRNDMVELSSVVDININTNKIDEMNDNKHQSISPPLSPTSSCTTTERKERESKETHSCSSSTMINKSLYPQQLSLAMQAIVATIQDLDSGQRVAFVLNPLINDPEVASLVQTKSKKCDLFYIKTGQSTETCPKRGKSCAFSHSKKEKRKYSRYTRYLRKLQLYPLRQQSTNSSSSTTQNQTISIPTNDVCSVYPPLTPDMQQLLSSIQGHSFNMVATELQARAASTSDADLERMIISKSQPCPFVYATKSRSSTSSTVWHQADQMCHMNYSCPHSHLNTERKLFRQVSFHIFTRSGRPKTPIVEVSPLLARVGMDRLLVELTKALMGHHDSYLRQRSKMCQNGNTCVEARCFKAHRQLDQELHRKILHQRQKPCKPLSSSSSPSSTSNTCCYYCLLYTLPRVNDFYPPLLSHVKLCVESLVTFTIEGASRLLLAICKFDPLIVSFIHSKSIICHHLQTKSNKPSEFRNMLSPPLPTQPFVVPSSVVIDKECCPTGSSCPYSHSMLELVQYTRILHVPECHIPVVSLSSSLVQTSVDMSNDELLSQLSCLLYMYPDSYLEQRSMWCKYKHQCPNQATCFRAHDQVDVEMHIALLNQRQQNHVARVQARKENASRATQLIKEAQDTLSPSSTILPTRSVAMVEGLDQLSNHDIMARSVLCFEVHCSNHHTTCCFSHDGNTVSFYLSLLAEREIRHGRQYPNEDDHKQRQASLDNDEKIEMIDAQSLQGSRSERVHAFLVQISARHPSWFIHFKTQICLLGKSCPSYLTSGSCHYSHTPEERDMYVVAMLKREQYNLLVQDQTLLPHLESIENDIKHDYEYNDMSVTESPPPYSSVVEQPPLHAFSATMITMTPQSPQIFPPPPYASNKPQ